MRLIHDRRLGRTGAMRGAAVLAPHGPDALDWVETGTLALGDWRGPAEQRYLIDGIDGPCGTLRFADGRPFTALDLAGGACTIVHDCAPDRYEGALRLHGAEAWTLCWRIAGPRKDQTIRTAFRRMSRK